MFATREVCNMRPDCAEMFGALKSQMVRQEKDTETILSAIVSSRQDLTNAMHDNSLELRAYFDSRLNAGETRFSEIEGRIEEQGDKISDLKVKSLVFNAIVGFLMGAVMLILMFGSTKWAEKLF